jgi:hypothetical protein
MKTIHISDAQSRAFAQRIASGEPLRHEDLLEAYVAGAKAVLEEIAGGTGDTSGPAYQGEYPKGSGLYGFPRCVLPASPNETPLSSPSSAPTPAGSGDTETMTEAQALAIAVELCRVEQSRALYSNSPWKRRHAAAQSVLSALASRAGARSGPDDDAVTMAATLRDVAGRMERENRDPVERGQARRLREQAARMIGELASEAMDRHERLGDVERDLKQLRSAADDALYAYDRTDASANEAFGTAMAGLRAALSTASRAGARDGGEDTGCVTRGDGACVGDAPCMHDVIDLDEMAGRGCDAFTETVSNPETSFTVLLSEDFARIRAALSRAAVSPRAATGGPTPNAEEPHNV